MGLLRSIFGHRRRGAQQPPKVTQAPTMSPEQKAAMDEILQLSLAGIKDPTKGFEPIAEQARTQFQTQTIPSLAERFTSMGAGAQRSSGFQEALGGAGTGLEEALASMQSQFGLQSLGAFGGLAGLGARPQFENIVQSPMMQQRRPGLLQNLLGMGAMGMMPGFMGGGGGVSRLFRRF